MLTGKMGAPDRPRQSVGRLRTQGRGQLARKASILEGPHPGTQIFIPLFPKYLFSSMCQSWCQAQQTQQGMKQTKIPAFVEFIFQSEDRKTR